MMLEFLPVLLLGLCHRNGSVKRTPPSCATGRGKREERRDTCWGGEAVGREQGASETERSARAREFTRDRATRQSNEQSSETEQRDRAARQSIEMR